MSRSGIPLMRIAGTLGVIVAVAASADLALASECDPAPYSNIGCDFYAVTLPNPLLDQSTFHFGVALLNAGGASVDVTVTGGSLQSADMFSAGAGALAVRQLPWVTSLSTSTETVKVAGGAYHIVATGPVSALQLNPSSYVASALYSYTNDGSLLLPVQSAGTAYRAIAWPTSSFDGSLEYPGNIAVVATTDATTVQVTAQGSIASGAGLSTNGGSVSLDRGDVLLIASSPDAPANGTGSDLSGTLITSDAPVLVWAGHGAADVPAATGFADHLEQVLLPVAALGDDYIVVRPGNPSGSETGARHMVEIVGTADGTTLTYDPAIAGAPAGIGAGQSALFEATVDFHLQASHPVSIGLFMEGANTTGFNGQGDPSQSIAIPTTHARRSVDFAAPSSLGQSYAQIVAPTGTSIVLDGSPVTGWSAVGASGFSAVNVALCCSDVHHASGNRAFTLSVYAYADYTSYWYPAEFGFDEIFGDDFE